MTKEQMEMLRKTANTMMMMAQAMKEAGYEDSMKAYARRGADTCKMLIQAEREWDEDKTGTIYSPLELVA